MLVLVPEPVWNTSMGNWSTCLPPAISSAAPWMAFAIGAGNSFRLLFASAAAHFTSPSARTNACGIGNPLIGKLFTARCVCAPHNAFAGTLSSPMLSRSIRNSAVMQTPRK